MPESVGFYDQMMDELDLAKEMGESGASEEEIDMQMRKALILSDFARTEAWTHIALLLEAFLSVDNEGKVD